MLFRSPPPLHDQCAAAVAIYSIGCEIFLPDSFTTNAQRYGLIGIAFGIVTYLFGFASLVVVTAIVAGPMHPPTRRLPRTLRFCYFPN